MRCGETPGRCVAPLDASHAGSGLGCGRRSAGRAGEGDLHSWVPRRRSSGVEGGLASRLSAAPMAERLAGAELLLGIGITRHLSGLGLGHYSTRTVNATSEDSQQGWCGGYFVVWAGVGCVFTVRGSGLGWVIEERSLHPVAIWVPYHGRPMSMSHVPSHVPCPMCSKTCE